MNTINAVNLNLSYYRVELSKARKVVCNNKIEQLHISGAITFYLGEIKDLEYSLNRAIKQSKKS